MPDVHHWFRIFPVLLAVACLAFSTPLRAGGKIALVIGNQAYEEQALRNAGNDAEDMGAALKRLGFEVIQARNAELRQMEDAVREFGSRLRNNEVGVFFYAGHGVQADGANYLIPINAGIQAATDLRYKAMDVGYVLDVMESSGSKLNIVMLDACRNNPYRGLRSGTRGLLNMSGPAGSIIAFATSPNKTAEDGRERNGIYTKYLLAHIETPGIGIEEMLKRVRIGVAQETQGRQTPWENSSLSSEFCFAGCVAPESVASRAKAAEMERVRLENERLQSELEKMRSEQRVNASRLDELRSLQKEKEKLEAQVSGFDDLHKAQQGSLQQLSEVLKEKEALERKLRERERDSASRTAKLEQLDQLADEKKRLELELKRFERIEKQRAEQLEELERIKKEKERLEQEAKRFTETKRARAGRMEELERLKIDNERLLSSLRERDERLRDSEAALREAVTSRSPDTAPKRDSAPFSGVIVNP